jgi:2-iminoacetate synthase ThiH
MAQAPGTGSGRIIVDTRCRAHHFWQRDGDTSTAQFIARGVLEKLVDAGINDWGGVSPLTPDYVNPEAPWPHLQDLAEATAKRGKFLQERLTIYPAYVRQWQQWTDKVFHTPLLQQ